MLSAKEAAERTGMSKAGIIKAVRSGRISATKNVNGEWEIDPAELFRVYAPATSEHAAVEAALSVVTTEEHLRTQLMLQREIIEKQEAHIAQLTAQLEAQNKVTLQLTDSQHASPRWWRQLFDRS